MHEVVSALVFVGLNGCFITLPICKMNPQKKKNNGLVMSKDQNLTF